MAFVRNREPRNCQINIRVSDNERWKIEEGAMFGKQTISDFIRDSAIVAANRLLHKRIKYNSQEGKSNARIHTNSRS